VKASIVAFLCSERKAKKGVCCVLFFRKRENFYSRLSRASQQEEKNGSLSPCTFNEQVQILYMCTHSHLLVPRSDVSKIKYNNSNLGN
jgi:hypothetical protein